MPSGPTIPEKKSNLRCQTTQSGQTPKKNDYEFRNATN